MNWAVVMAGGPGARFWPESRTQCPKPFLKLLGPKTLLEKTVERLTPLFPPSRILIVLQADLAERARKLLKRIPRENILGEPIGRNTAPCAVYAASQIAERDPDPAARFVLLPADQEISPRSIYLKTLKEALVLADHRPALLGIRPDSPNPAYGYLEVGSGRKLRYGISLYPVRRFHEKPSPALARKFLRKGNYFWNGGTFAWRLDAFRAAVQKNLPALYPAFTKLAPFPGGTRRPAALKKIYATFPSISIDYGVMEKIKQAHCLVAPYEWGDLGGWQGVSQYWRKDAHGNRSAGEVLFLESKGNLVKSNKRLVALLGVKGLLVVDTPDALLVCPASQTEKIRTVVEALKQRKAQRYL